MSSAAHPGSSLYPQQNLVEVALQEFPIYESATLPHKNPSTSTYNSLPWISNRIRGNMHGYRAYQVQNNSVLYGGAGEALASASNAGTSSALLPEPNQFYEHRFCAPAPSAVSSTTYGIPKRVGARYPVPMLPRSNARYTSTTSSSSNNSQRQRKTRKRRRRQKKRSEDLNTSKEVSMPPPYERVET